VHALVLEELLAGLARARALLADQQGMRFKVLQAQALELAQRVIRRRHGDDRVVEEGQELQAHVLGHHGHDDQVVAVVRQAPIAWARLTTVRVRLTSGCAA
jgi:hypothetical protein